jgi:Putative abortive phage resistance protein AbiGi, antitoxin
MTTVPASYDRAVHSDFLIHWTGKDIDDELEPNWYDDHHHSTTCPIVGDLYLERLRDILTYGLWMTDEAEHKFGIGSKKVTIPATPKCCFTELKLSESRRHAALYGRLGIGVKRPFLFERLGRPVTYFGYGEQHHNDRFLRACFDELHDQRLMNFFKPMNRHVKKLT